MTAKPFFNRELSWLEFNQRVLEEAQDAGAPLLERVKFLSITSSNLDEFFMVRVGGLQALVEDGSRARDPAGMTPGEQLKAVTARVHRMVSDQYACFMDELEPALRTAGIHRLTMSALDDRQKEHVDEFFSESVYPVVTPMAVDPEAPAPLLTSRTLYVGVRLKPPVDRAAGAASADKGAKGAKSGERPRLVLLPIGQALGRLVRLPGTTKGYAYITLEDVVAGHVEQFFPGEEVAETAVFRVTRNANLSVREDMAADLMARMAEVLTARKRSDCVRLELQAGTTRAMRVALQRLLETEDLYTYDIRGPLDLSSFMELTKVGGFDALRETPWPPQASARLADGMRIVEALGKGDLLLFHPQQSFDPVVRFVDEAADDPDVLAIKQILYRTSRQSPIIAALARAAGRGKYVTAIVELKARFDEERNIEWARALEESGVQVIYGIKGLKTHAKVCIVVRRESQGIRRYVHFGTGNYNEVTGRLYTDISYLTCNPELGADASAFFNTITGDSQPGRYTRLEQAPLGLRGAILALIDGEAERQRQGEKALILAKLNSLVDPELIRALYAASQAGVEIKLNVRGICCLQPGVAGLSENISVVSIVDRFLEHDRILYFRHGGDERLFISSADWMPRNLDRRIELLVPVLDPECRRQLLRVLEMRFADNVKARVLRPDGRYERLTPQGRKDAVRSQESLYKLACEERAEAEKARPTVFEPHRSPASTN